MPLPEPITRRIAYGLIHLTQEDKLIWTEDSPYVDDVMYIARLKDGINAIQVKCARGGKLPLSVTYEYLTDILLTDSEQTELLAAITAQREREEEHQINKILEQLEGLI